MIHRQSNDPVLVKKISLKIWSLRDEVESRIRERLAQGTDPNTAADPAESAKYLQDIVTEYTPTPALDAPPPTEDGKPALNLIKGGADEKPGEENKEAAAPEVELAVAPEAEAEAAPVDTAAPSAETTTSPSTEQAPEPILIRQKRPLLEASQLCHGRTLLGEIYMDKMMFFAGKRFCEGQSIVIEFLIPKRFIVNADVLYCRHYSMKSRIISGQKLPYRVNVQFTFLKPGERTLLREFLESIEPDLTTIKKEVKVQKPAAEGDELDDLANLDV